MPPTFMYSTDPSTSESIGHTHAPHNLTLPNSKKSPISHLDDLESDSYAFLRFMFVLLLIVAAVGVWLTIKFRMGLRKEHMYGSSNNSAQYRPLRVNDMLDISSEEDDEDEDVVLKLAG